MCSSADVVRALFVDSTSSAEEALQDRRARRPRERTVHMVRTPCNCLQFRLIICCRAKASVDVVALVVVHGHRCGSRSLHS